MCFYPIGPFHFVCSSPAEQQVYAGFSKADLQTIL